MENPQIKMSLAEALAKAQSEFTVPRKTKKVDFQPKNGPRVKYNYADLSDVLDAIKSLYKYGLSQYHTLKYDDKGKYGMLTVIRHESGEISTWYPLPDPNSMRPQEFGSALTYARRYSLSGLVGIASDDDDDGALATNGIDPDEKPKDPPKSSSSQLPPNGTKPGPQKDPPRQPSKPPVYQIGINNGLLKGKTLEEALKEFGVERLGNLLDGYKSKKPEDMTPEDKKFVFNASKFFVDKKLVRADDPENPGESMNAKLTRMHKQYVQNGTIPANN
jgi:hypothetical protein